MGDATDQQLRSRATLTSFRVDVYGCLDGWTDALFELADAMWCSLGPVSSVPHLSLETVFRRSHPSLYKALARGEIDAEALRQVLAAHRPADWPEVFAVDTSTWRAATRTSPQRGFTITRRATAQANRLCPAGPTSGSPS